MSEYLTPSNANKQFPDYRRIKKPADFSVVYNGNQTRVKGQYFTVLAFCRSQAVANNAPSDTIASNFLTSRVGVVASKKVSKRAVQRNRLKRLMRESFRAQQHPNPFDFVVIALPGAATVDNKTLAAELNNLWRRLHKRCAAL